MYNSAVHEFLLLRDIIPACLMRREAEIFARQRELRSCAILEDKET